MKSPSCLRLRLLGRLTLTRCDEPVCIRVSTRKAGAVLAYLAMNPDYTARREELAALLWGSSTDPQARQSLRQALALLRKDLGGTNLLASDGAVVQLQPGCWEVDAREFEDLSKSTDPQDLLKAARLFGGEFLSGLNIEEEGFDEWVQIQRQRMHIAAARLCETFALRPELVADSEQAVAAVERLLSLDPLREHWQRLALTLYVRYRGRSEALAQAEGFVAVLRRELGVGPEEETRKLVERIRRGEFSPAPVSASLPVNVDGTDGQTADAAIPGIAPIDIDDEQPPATVPVAMLQPADRKVWPRQAMVAALAILGILTTAGFIGFAYHPTTPRTVAQTSPAETDYWRPPPSSRDARIPKGVIPIAVLPFSAVGGASESTQLIADMMTDDLITILSRVPAFRVISRQTTSRYKSEQVDIAAIGAELKVKYVLEGTLRAQDAGLRVNLQLLDPTTRLPVWSGRVERGDADRHEVRDEIVSRIARELQIDILPIEAERRAGDPNADALAYRGWAAMNTAFAKTGVDAFKKARDLFVQALDLEPRHLSATIGLGAYHANVGAQVLDGESQVHLEKAREILLGVMERAPRDGSAPFYLGLVHGASGKLDDAIAAFALAVERNPSHAGAHAHAGHAMARMGRAAEGQKHLQYAIRLSPRDPNLAYWLEFIGSADLSVGRYREAIENFRRSTTLNPGYPRSWAGLAAAHALLGNMDEARRHADKLKTFAPQLNADGLIKRFGRNKQHAGHLHEGLRLALAAPADVWQPPPLPSEHRATNIDSAMKPITALAVLPFTTYGETTGSIQLIAETMTDDLTNILSRVGVLRVISRQTARSYQGQRMDIAAIGAELQVRYILEGSVRMHGEKLRVNVEMIDPATRLPAWSARIERDSADRHSVQDEIVGRLARELHFEIYKTESERASKDPDLAELTYIGWANILSHGTDGIEALKRAETAFTQILARNPDNWGGQSGLGAYHVLVGSLQLVQDWNLHIEKGEALLRDAIRAHPDSASSYFYLSIVQRMRGQLQDAMESLGRCLEISPSQAPCHAHVGHTMVQLGRAREGRDHIRYAMRLGPRDLSRPHWLRFAGEAEIELGQFEQAAALLRESYAANPRQPRTLRSLAAALALSGNPDEARKYLAQLQNVAPHMPSDGNL